MDADSQAAAAATGEGPGKLGQSDTPMSSSSPSPPLPGQPKTTSACAKTDPPPSSPTSTRGSCSKPNPSWWLVIYGFFAIAFTNGCFRAITIFMPDFIVEFEASATLVGWIFSIDPFMLGIMTPVAAYLTTKHGTRPVIMLTGAFAASGVLLLSQARHIGLVCFGIGALTSTTQATVYASSLLLIRRHFVKHYALAQGIVLSGYSCGLFVFPAVLEALSTLYSWRGTCLIASGFMLNTAVAGALMRERRLPRPGRRQGRYIGVESVDVMDGVDNHEAEKCQLQSLEPLDAPSADRGHADDRDTCRSDLIGNDGEIGNNARFDETACKPTSQCRPTISQCDRSSSNVNSELCQGLLPQTSGNPVSAKHLDNSTALAPEVNNSGGHKSKLKEEPDPATSSYQFLQQSTGDSPTPLEGGALYGLGEGERPAVLVAGVGCGAGPCARVLSRNYHTFILYVVFVFVHTLAYIIFLLYLTPSLKELGLELGQIATCLSVFAAFNLAGRVTNGVFVSMGVISAPSLMILAQIFMAASVTVEYLYNDYIVRVAAVAVYGVATGVAGTVAYVIHRQLVDPEVDVKTLSILMFFEGLAAPAGGSIGGLLRDLTGSYLVTFMTSAGLSVFAALLMVIVILLDRQHKRSSKPIERDVI